MGSTIICAVDGDDADSRHPVEVAVDLAERLGRPLVAACVAPPGFLAAGAPAAAGENLVVAPAPGIPYPYPVAPAEELDELREDARRRVERMLAQWGVDTGKVEVEVAVDASVADGLRRIATERDAELLVVGSRGRGTLRAALLGSTSHALAGDAPCPVVVVPTSG